MLNEIIDCIEEGLILIDRNGVVSAYNRRAKEITGVLLPDALPHPAGTIAPGDLVIIADSRLGYDDGDLQAADLAKIGIKSPDLTAGDVVAAIGRLGGAPGTGILKNWRSTLESHLHRLQAHYDDHTIEIEIDCSKKALEIVVDSQSYKMRYSLGVGHMVVLSGETGDLKFYQSKGFGIRGENIAQLLNGSPFLSKGSRDETVEVVGMPIHELFDNSTLIDNIEACREGRSDFFQNRYFEIHKRPTLCSLIPLRSSDLLMLKLFDLSNVEALIEERNRLIVTLEESTKSFEQLIGFSDAMQRVKYLVEKAARIRSTVLITGESGTGKTFIAREIHSLANPDNRSPFIAVNCTAIPQSLFESELFGYEKGAFTGAEKGGKKGFFELANGGTLFLDEIGELPPDMQVKLLHVLQNKEFYKVGATSPTQVDVRIISATNKDLLTEMEAKRFREDLYYRISSFPIKLPPLRERKNDLYKFIDTILIRIAGEVGGHRKVLSGEAFELLMNYPWPGNIRELENVLELAYNMSDDAWIRATDLNLPRTQPHIAESTGLKAYLQKQEKEYIEATLARCHYDSKAAMKQLNLSKTNFYDRIKRLGIELSQ
ncbi:MAG: sigma 54-interacting transcriptional regulator [Bacillota bacterium]|nr:sigma 54-interacting transcriptional regulator [Bacillota bacterium]